MSDMQTVPTRRTWLIIASALAVTPLCYGLVITMLPGTTPIPPIFYNPVPRPFFWLVAGAAVVASIAWTHVRLRVPMDAATDTPSRAQLLAPAEFQRRSIVSLALAEVACIVGLVEAMLYKTVMYRTPALVEFLPFAGATMLVVALDVVPLGLKYWSAWAAQPGVSEAGRAEG